MFWFAGIKQLVRITVNFLLGKFSLVTAVKLLDEIYFLFFQEVGVDGVCGQSRKVTLSTAWDKVSAIEHNSVWWPSQKSGMCPNPFKMAIKSIDMQNKYTLSWEKPWLVVFKQFSRKNFSGLLN